jgi:hypothetical protein
MRKAGYRDLKVSALPRRRRRGLGILRRLTQHRERGGGAFGDPSRSLAVLSMAASATSSSICANSSATSSKAAIRFSTRLMTWRTARMRSSFAMWVPGLESPGFATQPACFGWKMLRDQGIELSELCGREGAQSVGADCRASRGLINTAVAEASSGASRIMTASYCPCVQ